MNPDFSSDITFQNSDVTFSKLEFGCNVFKVRIYRFQSSDITFSFFPNFFFDFPPKISHNLLSLRYGADLRTSKFPFAASSKKSQVLQCLVSLSSKHRKIHFLFFVSRETKILVLASEFFANCCQ